MKIYELIQSGILSTPACAKTLGFELLNYNPDTMEIEVAFEASEQFANPVGNIQGGFLCAMLDDTMGPALVFSLDSENFAPTLELKTQFIKAAKVGRIIGRGRVLSKGKQVCFLEGELFQSGELVAKASATAIIR